MKKNRRKIIFLVICSIASVFLGMAWLERKEEISNQEWKKESHPIERQEEEEKGEKIPKTESKPKRYPKEEIISTYKGYGVSAKLEIPAISLETYILQDCNEGTLKKAVAKFWGADPNEMGNCCIAGHNAPRNKNMFYHLKELEIGDTLWVTDSQIGKVEYQVYKKYTVLPEDVTCLEEDFPRAKGVNTHYVYEQLYETNDY